jgi:hypothetical protein
MVQNWGAPVGNHEPFKSDRAVLVAAEITASEALGR